MQHAEERLAEEARVVARRDAAVAGAPMPEQNGWAVVSRRPAAKSNPNATAADSAKIFCRSIGYSRCRIDASGFLPLSAILRINGTSSVVRPAKITFRSAT